MPRAQIVIPGNPGAALARVVPALSEWLGPEGFVLGGGTVLAARWQHRVSADIDLFTDLARLRWSHFFGQVVKVCSSAQEGTGMARKRRRFTAEFKKKVALEALRETDTVQAIASRHEVHANQAGAWKRQAVDGLDEVFAGGAAKGLSEHEATVRDLHAKIGELTVERDFFSARVAALSRSERMGMVEEDGPLSLSRQCGLLGVSRSSLYYEPAGESAENLALMRRLDELHMEHPFYGSRQMAAQVGSGLQHRHDLLVEDARERIRPPPGALPLPGRRRARIVLDPVRGGRAEPRLGGGSLRRVLLSKVHVEPRLMVGDVRARHTASVLGKTATLAGDRRDIGVLILIDAGFSP